MILEPHKDLQHNLPEIFNDKELMTEYDQLNDAMDKLKEAMRHGKISN